MSARLWRLVVVWLLVILTIWVVEPYIVDAWWAATGPRTVATRGNLAGIEQATIALFKAASPSVVHVYARASGPTQMTDYGQDETVLQTGSGVVWDEAGDIVTNHHVIAGGTAIGVRLTSGEFVGAHVVGIAPGYDLAALRLERPRSPLRKLTIGSSANLQVGQFVFAIGNPYGLDQTLTNGIISALHRRLPESAAVEIADVIQTDAPINPGNSGGPLLDSAGRMIGLNTAILSRSGASSGIGFAIPIDTINRVVPQLIKNGHAATPGIGILTGSPALSAQLGLQGVIVLRTVPGSPAAKAGLQGADPDAGVIGDVITAVNGQSVATAAELSAALGHVGIGNTATLTVLRDGQTRTVKVTVTDIGAEQSGS